MGRYAMKIWWPRFSHTLLLIFNWGPNFKHGPTGLYNFFKKYFFEKIILEKQYKHLNKFILTKIDDFPEINRILHPDSAEDPRFAEGQWRMRDAGSFHDIWRYLTILGDFSLAKLHWTSTAKNIKFGLYSKSAQKNRKIWWILHQHYITQCLDIYREYANKSCFHATNCEL